MIRSRGLIGLSVALLLALSACSSAAGTDEATPTTTAASSATTDAATGTAPEELASSSDDDEGTIETEAGPIDTGSPEYVSPWERNAPTASIQLELTDRDPSGKFPFWLSSSQKRDILAGQVIKICLDNEDLADAESVFDGSQSITFVVDGKSVAATILMPTTDFIAVACAIG